jgi:hypothetical protein
VQGGSALPREASHRRLLEPGKSSFPRSSTSMRR